MYLCVWIYSEGFRFVFVEQHSYYQCSDGRNIQCNISEGKELTWPYLNSLDEDSEDEDSDRCVCMCVCVCGVCVCVCVYAKSTSK